MLASRGVRLAFCLLHAMHASTQLVQLDTPPCDRGTTWSIVSSSVPGWLPQYWQTYRSRLKTLRRLNVRADCGRRSYVDSAITSGTRSRRLIACTNASSSRGRSFDQSSHENVW